MVNIPASDYMPIDSKALWVFRLDTIDNYFDMVFLMLMVYDHALTFDKEVEWIWTLNWRLPKFIFLINRYVTPPLITIVGIVNMTFPVAPPVCNIIIRLSPWVALSTFVAVETILLIRVNALYGQQKVFIRFLVCFFILVVIAAIVNTSFLTKEIISMYEYEYLPGCPMYTRKNDIYSFWIPFVIFDGVVTFLTLLRVFSFHDCNSPTVSLLARDSIIYFLLIFVTHVVNVISFKKNLDFDLALSSECIACIAVSRMTMNIRGLVMEDKKHTLRLQTLRFPSERDIDDGRHENYLITINVDIMNSLEEPG